MLKKVGGGAPHTHTHTHTNTHTHTHKHTHLHRELNYNKFDGDCFALVGAHQHSITIHNQDVMREKESGVISFITYGGGGGGRENYAWGRYIHCALSPLLYQT